MLDTGKRGGGAAPQQMIVWAFSDQHALRVAITSAGRMKSASVLFWDGAQGWTGQARGREARWTRSSEDLALTGGTETLRVQTRGCAVTVERPGGALRIAGRAEKIRDGEALLFDLRFSRPLSYGWAMGSGRLLGGLRAEGRAQLGDREYLFAPAYAFGAVEENRVPWRALAVGQAAGETVCLAWGDGKTGSVMLTVRGGVTLQEARWEPFPAEGPWRWSCGTEPITFTPLAALREETPVLWRRKPGNIWTFGRFNGSLLLPEGEAITIRQMAGVVRDLIN